MAERATAKRIEREVTPAAAQPTPVQHALYMKEKLEITRGRRNVVLDPGFPPIEAQILFRRTDLMIEIESLTKASRLFRARVVVGQLARPRRHAGRSASKKGGLTISVRCWPLLT